MREFGGLTHSARRFRDSISNADPSASQEAWALAKLSSAEAVLWSAQAGRDRRHSLAVARHVGDAEPWIVVAALTHDVGKTSASLGVVGRTVATVLELLRIPFALGRLGRYLQYPAHGAHLLAAAASDPLVVAWAAEHHRASEYWSVPAEAGRLLALADRVAR